jgi:hypothetical protein
MLTLGVAAGSIPLRAERFISIPEAQRLCFTNATRFEELNLRLTRDDIKAIESTTRARVRNPAPKAWRAWRDTNLLGTVWFDQVIGKHELIDYVVAISPEGEVKHAEIVEYREHYGGEVRRRNWLDQFKGKTKDAPFKVGSDIYNISGATMSCQHVTEGIKRVLATYQQVRPRISGAAARGLPDKP